MRKFYKCIRVNNRVRTEHRYLAEVALGRPLLPNEDVHHIDGNKQNNSVDNLQVLTHTEHSSITGATRKTTKHKGATSQYRGVYFQTKYQKWVAYYKREGKKHFLGEYNSEKEAAEVAAPYFQEGKE